MRIIAGEYRGRTLKSLKGDSTRPTTDRVREAMMSRIFSARGTFEGAVVLDAFAGSGALGLEALSRGAAHATFCEQGRDAAKIVEANIAQCKLGRERYTLRRVDTFTLANTVGVPFDLVFLDPPYAYDPAKVLGFVADLDKAGRIAPGAIVCYEHAKKDKQAVEAACVALEYQVVSVKDYGDTTLITLRKETK